MADTRIDELRRRLERDPGSRLFAQLAEELRKDGELAEAIRVARAGLAVHPAYPSARLTLGRALLESGDAGAARVELESAVREAPDNILASRFLAQAREVLGDLKAAAEQYQKTLLMAPGDRQLQGALAAVEARLKAPAGDPGVEAATTPPAPRRAPPPMPGAAAGAPGPSAASTLTTTVPPTAPGHAGVERGSAPGMVFAPSRGAAPPEPADSGAEELPPTLRIRSSQTSVPPQPPPPAPRAAPPLPPAPPAPPAPAPPAPAPPAPAAAPAPARAPDLPGWPEVGPAVAQLGGPEAVDAPTLPGGAVEMASEPATVPPEPPPTPSESTAPFSSSTLAELYYQQGLLDRAKDVYRQLVEQDPGNAKARSRLAELERGGPSDEERAARRRSLERTIAGLESLLAAVRRR